MANPLDAITNLSDRIADAILDFGIEELVFEEDEIL